MIFVGYDESDVIQNQTNESTVEINNEIITSETNEDYTTRYDILIYEEDYSETEVFGPSFKYEDVGVYELNLMGAIISENIEMGQNIRITAKVKEYNVVSGLFFLESISTEFR